MDPLGDRSNAAKRTRSDSGHMEPLETPWSPFVPKRQCLAPTDASTAPSLSLLSPASKGVDISKYLEAKSEIERLKEQLAQRSNECEKKESDDAPSASTVRFYMEKCRQLEQKLSHMDTVKTENAVLRDNNAMMSRSLEEVSLKMQLLVADASSNDVMEKESLIRAEADKQVSLARKQRDDATARLREHQESNLSLNLKVEEKEEEVRELQTRVLMLETSLSTCRAENAKLRESVSQNASNSSVPVAMQRESEVGENMEAIQLEVEELRAMGPVMELLKRDCARIPELESQIDFLRLELTTAQSKRMNEEALQIQIDASAAVQRQLEASVQQLTVANVKLKEEAQAWLGTLQQLSAGRSVEDVLSFVADLQTENVSLLEKIGTLEAQARVASASILAHTKRVKDAENLAFDFRTQKDSLEGTLAQRDAKLQLMEQETRGLRALLDSYKMEDGIGGFDTQKSAQIAALETTLAQRADYARKLEEEVAELKTEMLQVNKFAKRMVDEKQEMEKRVGTGQVDASRTRVLHFAETPLDLLRKSDAEKEKAALEHKVNTLTEQIKVLDNSQAGISSESGAQSSSQTTRVDSAVYVQQQQELKLLRDKYHDAKVTMDRMRSATEVGIRRYMSSVWNVFGWKVDFGDKNRVKVRYKYWNDDVRESQAVLLFEYPSTLGQKGVNDQLEPFTLLDSPYSPHIPSDILDILRQPNTLPLFIAKLTEHLFLMVKSTKR